MTELKTFHFGDADLSIEDVVGLAQGRLRAALSVDPACRRRLAASVRAVADLQRSGSDVDTLIESIPDEWLHRAFPEGTVVVPRQKYLAFVEQQLADSRVIAARLNQMRAEGYCPERQRRADANRLQITRVR